MASVESLQLVCSVSMATLHRSDDEVLQLAMEKVRDERASLETSGLMLVMNWCALKTRRGQTRNLAKWSGMGWLNLSGLNLVFKFPVTSVKGEGGKQEQFAHRWLR